MTDILAWAFVILAFVLGVALSLLSLLGNSMTPQGGRLKVGRLFWWGVAIMVVAASLMLVGCGGDDAPAPTTPTGPTTTTPAVPRLDLDPDHGARTRLTHNVKSPTFFRRPAVGTLFSLGTVMHFECAGHVGPVELGVRTPDGQSAVATFICEALTWRVWLALERDRGRRTLVTLHTDPARYTTDHLVAYAVEPHTAGRMGSCLPGCSAPTSSFRCAGGYVGPVTLVGTARDDGLNSKSADAPFECTP